MFMKHKKIIISFIITLGCLALLINALDKKNAINPGIIEHFNLTSQTLNNLATKNDLLLWLDNEEEAIWNELYKTLNVSFEQFESLKKENLAAYNDSNVSMIKDYGSGQNVSQLTINFIHDIIQELGLNPNEIMIVAWNLNSAAAATDTLLFVNEEILNKLSLHAKKYAIGHELIHLIKKDHSTKFFIGKINYSITSDTINMDNPCNKLSRFQEFRADILSCFKGLEYAQGSCEFFKEYITLYGNTQNPSHPLSSLRLELGTKIAGILANISKQA